MPCPSPYSPDRSLSLAIAILTGGGLLVAACVYLFSTSAERVTDWHRTQLAETRAQSHAKATGRRPAQRPTPTSASGTVGAQTTVPPYGIGRLPVWTGPRASVLGKPGTPARNTYDLQPDMGYANLGAPSRGPGREVTDSKTDGSGVANSTDNTPTTRSAPWTTDFSTTSSNQEPGWRSEASTLGRRARALSGALAQRNHSGRSTDGGTRAEGKTSGDASTPSNKSSSGNTPDPPPNPEQVPVDGGLGWLAAAGAAYAANRLREQQNSGESNDEA